MLVLLSKTRVGILQVAPFIFHNSISTFMSWIKCFASYSLSILQHAKNHENEEAPCAETRSARVWDVALEEAPFEEQGDGGRPWG